MDYVKYVFFSIILCSFIFVKAQTWQIAYDSCLKYQEQQKFKTAIEWGDKALELYEKQVVVKDTNYSNILNRQVENCYNAGLYKQVEIYAKKDSIWAKQTNNEFRYATACNNLAGLYEAQARFTDAEPLYKEAKTIYEKVLGKEHPDYATSCNNLALLYEKQGRYSEAEGLYKEAKAIYEKVLGKEHAEYSAYCNNLGLLYRQQSRYSEAEGLYKEAKAIYEKVLGKEHPYYAKSCNNLGLLYRQQGRYSEAEELYKEAKAIREKVLGKEHPEYAQSCNNLAVLYVKQGRHIEAEGLYKEAKAIREKVLGKEHPEYAQSCNNLAYLYYSQGRYSEAEPLYKQAKSIIEKVFGREHPDYALSCNNLAALYYSQGHYNEAEELLKEAKAIREKILSKEHPGYAISCNSLANLYRIQGRYSEAEPLHKEALSIKFKEIERNFKNLSESEKESYIKANIEGYLNDFQYFVANRYKENPAIAEDAFKLTVETKGLILQSTEKIKNRILNSNDETLKQLYLEWKLTKDKYAKTLTLTTEQRKQKKLNLDSLAQRANELEKQLAIKSEDFAKTFFPKSVTWKDIQKTLKKDQAVVEIVRLNAKDIKPNTKDSIVYMALVVKKTSQYPEVIVLPNGNELESKYITNYRRTITTKVQDKDSYDAFWLPLKTILKDIKTVYFSPDGIYHQINVSTLQNPETKKYVSDEIQIINVTNSKDILEKQKFISKNNYLVGNPKFDLQLDNKDNQKPDEQRSIENLSQLEGAEKEVKQISAILPNAKTIIGMDATEEYVKSIKNPRILHIATHGYFKKGQYQSSTQAMLNAGLLFAGVVDYDRMDIRPLDKEDGKLTAFEVMNMELDSTELVVLSACETGLGQASKEGVYGLQRAFRVAGAQSIIMSLWKVNDEATQLLMTKFYENWQKKGMDKRKAFETAQKELRKQYKEPYYWGAFVMIE